MNELSSSASVSVLLVCDRLNQEHGARTQQQAKHSTSPQGWKRRIQRIAIASLAALALLWGGMSPAAASHDDFSCGSYNQGMTCTQGQAQAIAEGALAHYQQQMPQNSPYIIHTEAAPGQEVASYYVCWGTPVGCYHPAFYRARVFVQMPDNPCGAYSQRMNCTQAMALSIAKAAELYYLQRNPNVGAYILHTVVSSDHTYYCVMWTQPYGCYLAVYYGKPVVDHDPRKNLGPEQCPPQAPAPLTHCGNPINVSTGNKYQSEHDIGSSAMLGFTRHYNSDSAARSDGFGMHWTHTFSRRVMPAGAGSQAVHVLRPEGGAVAFSPVAGAWQADADVTSTLTEVLAEDGTRIGWSYVNSDRRETEAYDVLGRLLSVTDSSARVLSFAYNGGAIEGNADDLLLTSVTQEDGRSLVFEYDEYGRVVSLVDPAGAELAYQYDAVGRLQQVMFPGGATKTYLYNEPAHTGGANLTWALTGIVDEKANRYATFGYASDRKAVSTEHAGGVERVSVQYDANGTSTVSMPTGQTQVRAFVAPLGVKKANSVVETCAGCGPRTIAYTYDAYGRVDLATGVSGVSSDYDYDASGLLAKKIEASNDSTGVKRTVEMTWNAALRVPTERRTYSASGTLVGKQTWSYNARGQVLTSTVVDPVSAVTRATVTTYCEQADIDVGTCPQLGLVIKVDGPRADVTDTTTYTYYSSDEATCATSPTTCGHRKGDLWKVTNALGHVAEVLRHDGAGRVLSTRDANGITTDIEYHPRGWLAASKVRGADGASEADDLITRIEYEPTGLVKKTTLPDGTYTSFTYDAAHRLTDITDGEGNRIHYTLDNAGNRTKEDTLASNGSVQRTLSRVHNQLGQLQASKDAYNHATSFSYDASGNTNTTSDPLGRISDSDYDPLNRLTSTIQNLGGINATTQFKYDAQDNLTAVIDPNGITTGYTYNGLGDLTQLTSPDTGVTSYTYDSAGNRNTQTDSRGVTSTYGYDALRRLTTIGYPTTSLDVAYTYDLTPAVCTGGETFSVGRLTRMEDASGSTEYCYDRFGHLVRKVQTTNNNVFVLRYAYTKAGQLSAITYPDGTAVDYQRDTLGRTTSVGVTPAGGVREVLLREATYYPFGPAAEWVFGNGRLFQRTLNQNYQPGVVQDGFPGGLSVGYEFDAVGNLSTLRNGSQNDPPQRLFGYDALNRLTETKDGTTAALLEGYTYDATGNRTSATVGAVTTPYTTATTSHRLDQVGGEARSYDAVGNTVAIDANAREFIYNDAGRMSQVKLSGGVVRNYVYNGNGEQVRRYLRASTYAAYDEAGHWLGDYGSTGAPIQQAIWLDDLPVGVIVGGTLHYIEADHLGTPRVVIDPQRDVAVWHWDLAGEAFGNSAPNQDPDGDASEFFLNLRFPGQRYDAASGLNYNYFRDYDPTTGRYAQSDPIGLRAGVSTYGYVSGSPLIWADMYGLLQWATNPIVWSPTLAPGLQTRTFPGDGASTVTGSSAARTTLDWSITPACACSSGGYSLNEYTVNFTPVVFLRQTYSSSDERHASRRAELDHVRDFGGWIGGARNAAQALEDSMKGQSFASTAECENAARQAMQQLLQSGARQTAIDSHRRWDASGRHTQVIPGP